MNTAPVSSHSAWLRNLVLLLGFAAATTILTWPLAFSPGEAISARGDYILNLWNIWWAQEAVFDSSLSLYQTDALHYPHGVSLARPLRGWFELYLTE